MSRQNLLFKLSSLLIVLTISYSSISIPLTHHTPDTKLFSSSKKQADENLTDVAQHAYYGQIYVGTPPQPINVAFDIAVYDTVIPQKGCDCHESENRYEPQNSTSFNKLFDYRNVVIKDSTSNGLGIFVGAAVQDRIAFGAPGNESEQLVVENATFLSCWSEQNGALQGVPFDGMMGLNSAGVSPNSALSTYGQNFFEVLYGDKDFNGEYAMFVNDPFNKQNNTLGANLHMGGKDVSIYAKSDKHKTASLAGAANLVSSDKKICVGENEFDSTIAAYALSFSSDAVMVPTKDFESIAYEIFKLNQCTLTSTVITCSKCVPLSFPNVYLKIGGSYLKLTPTDYIRYLDPTTCVVKIVGSPLPGYAILGQPLLRRYYTVWESHRQQVRFYPSINADLGHADSVKCDGYDTDGARIMGVLLGIFMLLVL